MYKWYKRKVHNDKKIEYTTLELLPCYALKILRSKELGDN